MHERKRNVAVGLTTAIGLTGVLVMLWLFGNIPGWFAPGYPVTLQLPHAGNVQAGGRVLLSGIEVGEVQSVHLIDELGSGVNVTLRIREQVRVPRQAQARIQTQQLFGGTAAVALDVPPEIPADQLEPLPTDGTAVLRGEVPTLAGTMTQELQTAIEGPMEDFQRIADSFETLSSEWQLVGEHLNLLLEPRPTRGRSADGEDDPGPNVATILEQVDDRLEQMQTVLDNVNRYVGDDELYDDVRMTARNARELTDTVSQSVDELSASVNENIELLSHRYVALADDLSGTVRSMDTLVREAGQGEGTVGRLVNDPRLYDNLNDTAERMQLAVDELRLLIEKWQVEGVPVRW